MPQFFTIRLLKAWRTTGSAFWGWRSWPQTKWARLLSWITALNLFMIMITTSTCCSTSTCLEGGMATWRCATFGDTALVNYVSDKNIIANDSKLCELKLQSSPINWGVWFSANNRWEAIQGSGDAPGCLQDHTMVAYRYVGGAGGGVKNVFFCPKSKKNKHLPRTWDELFP